MQQNPKGIWLTREVVSMSAWRIAGSAMAVAAVMNGLMCPTQAKAGGPTNLPSTITAVWRGGLTPEGAVEPAENIDCEYNYVDNPS